MNFDPSLGNTAHQTVAYTASLAALIRNPRPNDPDAQRILDWVAKLPEHVREHMYDEEADGETPDPERPCDRLICLEHYLTSKDLDRGWGYLVWTPNFMAQAIIEFLREQAESDRTFLVTQLALFGNTIVGRWRKVQRNDKSTWLLPQSSTPKQNRGQNIVPARALMREEMRYVID